MIGARRERRFALMNVAPKLFVQRSCQERKQKEEQDNLEPKAVALELGRFAQIDQIVHEITHVFAVLPSAP